MDVADCAASVHHKINDKTEVGLSTAYNINTSNVALGMVGKYSLEDGATVKVFKFLLYLANVLYLFCILVLSGQSEQPWPNRTWIHPKSS